MERFPFQCSFNVGSLCARNSVGVRPCTLLKACTKLLACLTPITNAISFTLRKVLLSKRSACRIRSSRRYFIGERPVSFLKSCRSRVGERLTRLDNPCIVSASPTDPFMKWITAATRASIKRAPPKIGVLLQGKAMSSRRVRSRVRASTTCEATWPHRSILRRQRGPARAQAKRANRIRRRPSYFRSFSRCSSRNFCQRAYCSPLPGSASSSPLSQKQNQSTVPP